MLERESYSDSVIEYTSDKYDGRFNGSILKNLSKGLALHSPSSSATTNLSNVNLKPLSSGELWKAPKKKWVKEVVHNIMGQCT